MCVLFAYVPYRTGLAWRSASCFPLPNPHVYTPAFARSSEMYCMFGSSRISVRIARLGVVIFVSSSFRVLSCRVLIRIVVVLCMFRVLLFLFPPLCLESRCGLWSVFCVLFSMPLGLALYY